MEYHFFYIILSILLFNNLNAQVPEKKLEGIPISFDNSKTAIYAFDGDLSTQYVSSTENGWVGLELSSPSIITKIGFYFVTPDQYYYELGMFEGANDRNFNDAVPLNLIIDVQKGNEINYIKVDCQIKFKYVRYVGPESRNSVINEFEIYGYEPEVTPEEKYFQFTNIPTLAIHTEEEKMPDEENPSLKLNANFILINNGKVDTKGKGTIKLRGNSSLMAQKKSYSIKFDKKARPLNMPSEGKKWALIANMYDKTLIRSTISYELGKLFGMKFTPTCKHIDIVFNGFFMGNYLICEKIEVSKDRVNIQKMDETCIEEPEISGGYLVEGDASGKREKLHFKTNHGIRFLVKYPDEDIMVKQQYLYIEQKFNNIGAEIYSNNVNNIDLESFAKYFILEEYSGNCDEIFNSFYIYKYRSDDKLYFGPLWDFDIAYDNNYILFPTNEKPNFSYKFTIKNGSMKKLVTKLISNDLVLSQIKKVWSKMKQLGFDANYVTNFIDERVKLIYESQKLNFIKWKILGIKIFMEPQIFETYDEEVAYLRKYVIERYNSLDKIIVNSNERTVQKEYKTEWDDYWPEDEEEYEWPEEENIN